jgi:hypothetical protein
MSTRANIKIVGESYQTTILYRHCDGYPLGLGAELDDFVANHGYEPIYTDAYAKEIIKSLGEDIEFTSSIHGDIEYLYVINLVEKKYSMYKVTYDYTKTWNEGRQNFVKIEDNE